MYLKVNVEPFENEAPEITRNFMLTYDQSTDVSSDFRYFIIAALHAGGAHHIKSYVASGIIFQATATSDKSNKAINRWKNYLNELFNNNGTFGQMICITRQYDDNSPIFLKVPYGTIEEEFDDIRDVV
ncbi:MAG: hypothetical protein ACXVHT_01235, partial [Methanobacterium sp.]